MLEAIFIAPSYQQAEIWARHWHFRPWQWKYCRFVEDVDGINFTDIEVFVCGVSDTIIYGTHLLIDYLKKHTEARFVDAQADSYEERDSWFQILEI